MSLKIRYLILIILCVKAALTTDLTKQCLTGKFGYNQTWVDDNGNVIQKGTPSAFILDVSTIPNPIPLLRRKLATMRKSRLDTILNMSKCQLKTVPQIFRLTDGQGRSLSETVTLITMYGNDFQDFDRDSDLYEASFNASRAKEAEFAYLYGKKAEASWPLGFWGVTFTKLKELDLRSSGIQTISNNIFKGMIKLEALYLSGNNIFYIGENGFEGLRNLKHLDLSRNVNIGDNDGDLYFETNGVLNKLRNLVSLDLSFTRIAAKRVEVLRFGRKFERLSLCYSGLRKLTTNIFNQTSLKVLDVSGNFNILDQYGALSGVENSLEVLFAENIALFDVNVLKGFKTLTELNLINNELMVLPKDVVKTWTNLSILYLDNNRLGTWTENTFSSMPNLTHVSLKNNNINVIKPEMIHDIHNLQYIELSGNFFVCNCYAREFIDISFKNAKFANHSNSDKDGYNNKKEDFSIKTLFGITDSLLRSLNFKSSSVKNEQNGTENNEIGSIFDGNFTLYDYDPEAYVCLSAYDGKAMPFEEVAKCDLQKEGSYEAVIENEWNKLVIMLVLPLVAMLTMSIIFYYRRNIKYFYITMKNSAMLSLIDDKEVNEDTIFTYDVFVSYCNEDRGWVLDHLLPQVEKECSVSICLHERDFQVGLSILENIVSCMDRSKAIMLIISKKFLLSQWCQFEMHLAQHRLLETRREDLILVLLEEIPRRLRPNTLHYLMLTKTYVQWPKEESDRIVFWRRVKKSLVTQKNKRNENISLA